MFSDHIKEKVLIAKKKDLFGGSTLKKSRLDKNRIYIHKNSFYHNFFAARAQRKEKKRKAFRPTVAGWIETLNVKRLDHLAGILL